MDVQELSEDTVLLADLMESWKYHANANSAQQHGVIIGARSVSIEKAPRRTMNQSFILDQTL